MPIQWHTPRTLPPQWLAGQPVSQAQHDAFWMERCLQLAQRGAEGASPNPLVGCVIVAGSGPFEGRVIGEGFHAQAGQAHAEVDALRQAQEAIAAGYFPASVLQGATLYVNLEPCCHTGKTGPCTEVLKEAGIGTVVCGTLDPNPQVAGQGRDTLQRSQISVRVGVLAQQCEELNRPFFYWMRTGLPYVTLKLATSVDGRLGPRASAWMTSEAARHDVHRQRARVDAILTTATTVLADNPQLTVREGLSGCQPGLRQPLRVVLDRHNRLNHAHTYHVLNPHQAPTVCVVGQMADLPSRLDNVNDSTVAEDCPRVERITAPQRGAGFDLEAVLRQLAQHHGVSHLWVEAGGTLAGSLLSGQWVNRLRLYTAPYIIGDTAAPATVSGLLCGSLQQAIGLNILSHQWLETTQVLDAEPLYPDFVG